MSTGHEECSISSERNAVISLYLVDYGSAMPSIVVSRCRAVAEPLLVLEGPHNKYLQDC